MAAEPEANPPWFDELNVEDQERIREYIFEVVEQNGGCVPFGSLKHIEEEFDLVQDQINELVRNFVPTDETIDEFEEHETYSSEKIAIYMEEETTDQKMIEDDSQDHAENVTRVETNELDEHRPSIGPPLPGEFNMDQFSAAGGMALESHAVNMYFSGDASVTTDEVDVSMNEILDEPQEFDTGDPITAMDVTLWRPVLESFQFPQFEVAKRLHLLSKTTEFFQFVHKHLVDEQVIIESKFPQVEDWKKKTSVFFDFKRKNNVGNISKALDAAHDALRNELIFLERSRIFCTEERAQKIISFQHMKLGSKMFRVGTYSVDTPKNFFTLGKRTFQSDDWKGALSKYHPGRTLMEVTSIYEQGEMPEPGDANFEESRALLQAAEEEKLHNIALSEFFWATRVDPNEATANSPVAVIRWNDIKNHLNSTTTNKTILESLEKSFENVEYIVNPHPEYLTNFFENNTSNIRIISSPIIWLHSFTRLLSDRAGALFTLKNAIMEFLRGRRKKHDNEKGRTRKEVENLQREVDDESERMKEVIQNLRIPSTSFDEFYDT